MSKSFNELKEYLGGVRLGNYDNIEPMADLGDLPPKGQAGKDSRGVGLNANYTSQAAGTIKPMLTANVQAKKVEMLKLMRKAMSTMPGSQKQKDIIKQLNVVRKQLNLEPLKEEVELTEDRKLTKSDLDSVEKYADRIFGKIKLDVEFTRHFLDRVNDARNGKQITSAELTRLFKQTFNKHKNKLQNMSKDASIEAVLNDTRTDINMPFVIQMNGKGELDMVAKTVMRKKNFSTSNTKLKVEDTKRIPRKPGQKAGSDKHSDLYTDENPRGTIHGLGFTDAEKAKQSVNKIKGSGKTHAHKIQAAIAMSQRAKVASQRAKDPQKKKDLGAAHKVYQAYIDSIKKDK